MGCVSVTMTVWASAWLHFAAAADDVLDALLPWAELHEVVAADEATAALLDLPEPAAVPVSPAMLLAALRRSGATVTQLTLPVPGDVRGLGTSHGFSRSAFNADALRAGQAVLVPDAELGIVPVRIADGVLRWTVYRVGVDRGIDYVGLADAEHALRSAVRQAAATLSALDIARHRPEVRKEIADTLASRPRPPWPAGTPSRVLRVLEQADEVSAILAAAGGGAPTVELQTVETRAVKHSAAISTAELATRSTALRPLAVAVRTARLAAVAETVRVLTDQRAAPH
jgi:hypothetical protein